MSDELHHQHAEEVLLLCPELLRRDTSLMVFVRRSFVPRTCVYNLYQVTNSQRHNVASGAKPNGERATR